MGSLCPFFPYLLFLLPFLPCWFFCRALSPDLFFCLVSVLPQALSGFLSFSEPSPSVWFTLFLFLLWDRLDQGEGRQSDGPDLEAGAPSHRGTLEKAGNRVGGRPSQTCPRSLPAAASGRGRDRGSPGLAAAWAWALPQEERGEHSRCRRPGNQTREGPLV